MSDQRKLPIFRFLPVYFMILLFCFSACADQPVREAPPVIPTAGTNSGGSATATPAAPTPTEPPEPGTPDRIGFYINDGGSRIRITGSHAAPWLKGQDIKCYEAITSEEAVLTGSGFTDIWNTAWNQYSNTQNVKIGYSVIIFLKTGESLSYDIKTPADTQKNREYVETYLYDDVHQTPGQWYSHLETADIKEETVATSIKFTAGEKIDEIDKISLTAYLYTTARPEHAPVRCTIELRRE